MPVWTSMPRTRARVHPTLYAAQNGNLEAVTRLLTNGANVNAVSAAPVSVKHGLHNLGRFTPLTFAAGGPVDVVNALLAAGAQVNATEARGLTPLMVASAIDHADLETVHTLITHGADLGAKSVVDETALDSASQSGPTRCGERAEARPCAEWRPHDGPVTSRHPRRLPTARPSSAASLSLSAPPGRSSPTAPVPRATRRL